MKFHVYNSQLKVIATYVADDLDAACDLFLCNESESVDVDCISDHVTILRKDDTTIAVAEDGYMPDADDFA